MQAWRRASGSLFYRYSSLTTLHEAGHLNCLSPLLTSPYAGWSAMRCGSAPIGECIPQRTFRSSAAALGVMDSVRSAYDTAMQGSESKREAKVFEAQIKYLTSEKRIDGDVFLELLEEMKVASGVGGVKEHLPWVQSNPALGEFNKQQEVLRALTPAERANIFAIGIGAVKRAARATEMDMHAVESLLGQIKSMVGIQKWMRNRMKEGGKLPESSQEMQNMLMKPGSGISRKAGRGQKVNPGIKGGTTARRKVL